MRYPAVFNDLFCENILALGWKWCACCYLLLSLYRPALSLSVGCISFSLWLYQLCLCQTSLPFQSTVSVFSSLCVYQFALSLSFFSLGISQLYLQQHAVSVSKLCLYHACCDWISLLCIMYQFELFYQTAVTVSALYVFVRQLMGTVRCFIIMLCYKNFLD
jgi:hypothetical protein